MELHALLVEHGAQRGQPLAVEVVGPGPDALSDLGEVQRGRGLAQLETVGGWAAFE